MEQIESPAWNQRITQETFSDIEHKYGGLATSLAEIADLVRLSDKQSSPPPTENDVILIIAMQDSKDERGIGLYASKININSIMLIHYSLLRHKPFIELYTGELEGQNWYNQLRTALSFRHTLYPGKKEVVFEWNGENNKAEAIAKQIEKWQDILASRSSSRRLVSTLPHNKPVGGDRRSKSIEECQTPEELAEAIAAFLKKGGTRLYIEDSTVKPPTRKDARDDAANTAYCGRALSQYNKIRGSCPSLPLPKIDTSDPLSALAQIQGLCQINANKTLGGRAEKKTGFKFSRGQIHYNGKEITVSMGRQYGILKKLAEKTGEVINYNKLDSQSSTSASEQLRTDISEIKKSLKKAKIPFTINSKRTEGYILTSK